MNMPFCVNVASFRPGWVGGWGWGGIVQYCMVDMIHLQERSERVLVECAVIKQMYMIIIPGPCKGVETAKWLKGLVLGNNWLEVITNGLYINLENDCLGCTVQNTLLGSVLRVCRQASSSRISTIKYRYAPSPAVRVATWVLSVKP